MPENTKYFEAITAQRSLLVSEEDALAGNVTISLETAESNPDDIFTCVSTDLPLFMRALCTLSKRDRELLISYYLLGIPQHVIATLFRTTQTLSSLALRAASARLGCYILLGELTQPRIAAILLKHALEHTLAGIGLSYAVTMYAECRSYEKVAKQYKLHRPDIRKAIRQAEQHLTACDDPQAKALGAYLAGLTEKSSAGGTGLSVRQRNREGHMFKIDSSLLGDFRIDFQHPDFDQVFVSKAVR